LAEQIAPAPHTFLELGILQGDLTFPG